MSNNQQVNPLVQLIVNAAMQDPRLSASDKVVLAKAPEWIAQARDLICFADIASYAGIIGVTPGTAIKQAIREDKTPQAFAAEITAFLEGE
jgi:hypothetical protein